MPRDSDANADTIRCEQHQCPSNMLSCCSDCPDTAHSADYAETSGRQQLHTMRKRERNRHAGSAAQRENADRQRSR